MIGSNSTNQVVELFDLHSEHPNPKAIYLEASNRAIGGSGPTSISNGFVKVVNAALESAEEVNRPPPKSPHLFMGGETADLNSDGSSAEVGASVRGMCTSMTVEGVTRPRAVVVGGECTTSTNRGVEGGADATVTEGGLITQLLRRFIRLTPPSLLTVVFSWDREGMRSEKAVRTVGSEEALRRRVPFSTESVIAGGGALNLRPASKGNDMRVITVAMVSKSTCESVEAWNRE
ncbi:hypothetical protein PIB30_012452 [Stylosanthes scabra]|uniref:Uncharacterized protein n=1 Tax=Stylosanthes scabra TaxID=79078 RepID=A0ABU6T5U2_9FABA|nr:hypothetical protein [Stylosanthes scabra]